MPSPNPRHDHIRQDRRILDIAREQIKRFGAKRLTVVSVAEEAGMTHANVYRYFASKLALCDALTAHWLREVEARLSAVVDSPDPADDKLERLLLDLMRQHRSHIDADPELYSLLIDAYAKNRTVRVLLQYTKFVIYNFFFLLSDQGPHLAPAGFRNINLLNLHHK